MSVQAMSWVIDFSVHSSNDFVVLLMIANHAKSDGSGAWPSVPTLAKEARCSIRAVQYSIQRLVRSGELHIDRESGPQKARVYSVPGVQILHPRGANGDMEGCKSRHRNKEEPSIKQPSRSVATRIPEEFMPKDEHYTIAAELGANCDGEFQKFRDYYLGTSGSKAAKCDWDATFRNWLRNSLNYGGRANGREPTKAEQRVINSRKNILIALGDIPAPGAGRAGISVGDPTGPDEGLAEMLSKRKS